jgi:hypothetical protein
MQNKEDLKGLGVVSLVCGIVGFWIFGIILGIVAIITGALSWGTKIGKVGFVLGVIDVVGVLVFFS